MRVWSTRPTTLCGGYFKQAMCPIDSSSGGKMKFASLIFILLFHHSFAAEFDSSKSVELKGTVTRLDWVNPHAWIYLDVKDEKGTVISWGCELGSPNLLMRNGWSRDSLKAGDTVVVSGWRAKDGSNIANARAVRFADGKRVFNAGSSGDQTQ
jgi:hypothetical protein